jgi:hypothetical protein
VRPWLLALVFLLACDPAVRFQVAPGAARRPAVVAAAVQLLSVHESWPLPPGVDYRGHDEPSYHQFYERCDALVVTRPHPAVAFLGTIDDTYEPGGFGQAEASERFLRSVTETAAAHGANRVYQCGKRYFAFWVDPGLSGPAAAEVMAPVVKRAAAEGYHPSGEARITDLHDALEMPFAADTCYAIGFALDRTAGWGEPAETQLWVDLFGGGDTAPAMPVGADPGARRFELARAGWQVLGCFHVGFSYPVKLVTREPDHGSTSMPLVAAGLGPVALQLFARPPTADERARLARLTEHDRRRMALCEECAPFMLTCPEPTYDCPAFVRCLARKREHNAFACDGRALPAPSDWDPGPGRAQGSGPENPPGSDSDDD